jgi:hypothetical protein
MARQNTRTILLTAEQQRELRDLLAVLATRLGPDPGDDAIRVLIYRVQSFAAPPTRVVSGRSSPADRVDSTTVEL